MSHTQVGACPRCGAPIYAVTVWHGILPPPSTATCGCAGSGPRIVTTPHTGGRLPIAAEEAAMRDPADVIHDVLIPIPVGSYVRRAIADAVLAALRDEYGIENGKDGGFDMGLFIPVPVPEGSAS